MTQTVPLQCPEVVGVTKLCSQFLEYLSIDSTPLGAHLTIQKPLKINGHAVIVEQGIVDVEKEDCFQNGHDLTR